jgi:HME family heavy-metal exporter
LHIRLRPDDLALFGVSRAYVAEFLQTALQGEVVSQVLEGQRRFDLLVRLEEPYRTDYPSLARLRLDLPDNRGQVMLGELADIGPGVGANQVNRENARRRIVVRCNASGRDLAGVVADVQQRVAERVPLPEGYTVEYGGQFESQRRATTLIAVLAGVSLVGMFVVLLMLFPSVRGRSSAACWPSSSRIRRSRWQAWSGSSRWAESRCGTAFCWSRITST